MYATAEKFDVVESSVHICVDHVVHFLHSISDDVIRLPDSAERSCVHFVDSACTCLHFSICFRRDKNGASVELHVNCHCTIAAPLRHSCRKCSQIQGTYIGNVVDSIPDTYSSTAITCHHVSLSSPVITCHCRCVPKHIHQLTLPIITWH